MTGEAIPLVLGTEIGVSVQRIMVVGAKGRSMKRRTRVVMIVVGLGLMLFGGLSMNFSKSSTLEHHRAWAREHGMPEPSR